MSSHLRAQVKMPVALAISAALYAVLALAFTFPLITHLNSAILRGIDTYDALQQAWVLAWVQHAIATHHLALFDAPIFYPVHNALTFQDTLAPLAVLIMPVQALTQNPLVVYNVAVLLSFPLCGLSMYPLAYYLSQSHRASFLAGLIFAFCPYRERHIEHLNLLSAEAIPLIILSAELVRTRGGSWRWLALGLSIALCALLSVYYLAYTLLGLGCYILALLLRRRAVFTAGAARGFWAVAPGLALAVVGLLPYLRTQHAMGAERRLNDLIYFSADVRDFLHTGSQSLLYGWTDSLWHIAPLDVRQYLFPGWIALALAVFGARRVVRHGERTHSGPDDEQRGRTYLLTAGLLGILALGPYLRLFGTFTGFPLPYLAVYRLLPGYAGFRDVARLDQVLMAFLAVGAAIGASRLLASLRQRLRLRVFIVLAALIVLECWTVQKPLLPIASGAAIPPVYTWLAHQPTGVTAELPICGMPGPPCQEESFYMYYSAYHWHPIVNGGGGFFPPGWNARTAALSSFPSSLASATLRDLGVRYLIIHPNYPRFSLVRTIAAQHGVASWPGQDLVLVLDKGAVTRSARIATPRGSA